MNQRRFVQPALAWFVLGFGLPTIASGGRVCAHQLVQAY